MSAPDEKMLVTLTVEQLRELVRSEVQAGFAAAANAPAAVSPAVLSTEAAAKYLSIPVSVLRKRAAKGEVPSFKVGALLRFNVAELDDWMKSLSRKAG